MEVAKLLRVVGVLVGGLLLSLPSQAFVTEWRPVLMQREVKLNQVLLTKKFLMKNGVPSRLDRDSGFDTLKIATGQRR